MCEYVEKNIHSFKIHSFKIQIMTWSFILANLEKGIATALLYVVDSQGSSPGRKGFLMAVNEEGVFEGTIGGGIMEIKMIELAKSLLKKRTSQGIIKEQFHDKRHARNQSGLICSGAQTVVCMPLNAKDKATISAIVNSKTPLFIRFDSQVGIALSEASTEKIRLSAEDDFEVITKLHPPKTVHIFGAGHVGLALAKQMRLLDYRIIQYDDRPDLPTLSKNTYAHEIKVIDYEEVQREMQASPTDIVIIVSFSYRSDKLLLRQLYNLPFAYIGMMGSDHKIATLKKELAEEGISADDVAHVFTPIGLNMYSKTAAEIAVSIAGQIILEANKGLPTGRNY